MPLNAARMSNLAGMLLQDIPCSALISSSFRVRPSKAVQFAISPNRSYSIMNRAKREAGLLPATTHRGQKEETKKNRKDIESRPEKPVSLTIRHPISPTERMVKVPASFQQPDNPRLSKVALLGAANAGKSTIINSLIGENISVVSARAHTTRERILASWTKDNYQVVFLDTPGIIYGRNQSKMNRNLVNASWQSLIEADHCRLI
jgi:predicted GTPase